MLASTFVLRISGNKADAFIVVGMALTVWVLLTGSCFSTVILRVEDHRLAWRPIALIAAVPLVAAFLLGLIGLPWLVASLAVLLVVVAMIWLARRADDEPFKNHLEAGLYLALGIVFWLVGLVMITRVLTGWQTAALTLGLAAFGASFGLASRIRRRWRMLATGRHRGEAIASYLGVPVLLALGVVLIGALIATS